MGTQEIAIQLGGLRRQELRRLFAISAIAHLALIAAFGFSPQSRISVPRRVIAVELVTAPAAARPAAVAKPAPAKPAPPKPPAPIKPKKILLPAEPTTPKVEPKVAKPAVVPKPPPAKPTPAPAENYEDVMAKLRAESGEDAPPTEVAKAAPTAIGSPGSPDGVAISPEVAAWLKRAKIHVRKNWVVPPGFRTQALEARVVVDLDASGGVRGTPRLSRRSGNPWYDDGVIRAIQKSSPLPPPPEAGKWNFVFMPEDSY
jgi:colicin import membrane protein